MTLTGHIAFIDGKIEEGIVFYPSSDGARKRSSNPSHNFVSCMLCILNKMYSVLKSLSFEVTLLSIPVGYRGIVFSRPTELLIHADSLDPLCLALSCKRLLQISASVSVKIPSLTISLSSCPKTKLLRRLMPLDARGRPKRSWAVCGDCLRYRPTRKSYWKAKQSVWVKTKTWEGVVKS
jgi:hypothetical protein